MPCRCPSCFLPLEGVASAFRCVNDGCPVQVDEVASRYAGERLEAHVVTALPGPAPSGFCRDCGQPTQAEVCPRCHWSLPPGWRDTVTTCIAMAGARASGKSIYIAVMKKQAELLVERMRGALGYADGATRDVFERFYERPLYEQRGLMAATPRHGPDAPQRQPLVFTMGTAHGRPHLLVLRDVAGENLEDPSVDPQVFGFFRDADAVLFLVDPLQVTAIREQLRGAVMDTQPGADPLVVLDNVIRVMRGGAGASTSVIPTPLGVVLSKFDTLQMLAHLEGSDWRAVMGNPGAAFNRESLPEAPELDGDDTELLAAEVRSLLVRLRGQALLNRVEESFAVHGLFAVSALGAPPVAVDVQSDHGIAPFRCLDPLKWALAHAGVLSVT